MEPRGRGGIFESPSNRDGFIGLKVPSAAGLCVSRFRLACCAAADVAKGRRGALAAVLLGLSNPRRVTEILAKDSGAGDCNRRQTRGHVSRIHAWTAC